jgi:hypothetical protein
MLLARRSSADAQVGGFAGALVGDEAYAVAVLLHHLAVAREQLFTSFQCAAEIAVAPGPGAADSAAEGAATDAARRADSQTDAQTGQAFAAHEIDEGPPVGHAAKVARYRRRSKEGEKENRYETHSFGYEARHRPDQFTS